MVRQTKLYLAAVFLSAILFSSTNSFATSSRGNTLNTNCAPNNVQPFTGDNCSLCHVSDRSIITEAMRAYNDGVASRVNYFCPAPEPPLCTDGDNDTFAVEGGTCGPVDCDDNDPAINPAAVENCTDKRDNDCDGFVDNQDLDAVGCLPDCFDNDNDTFAVEGGACGPVDCNDNDPAINPGAVDIPNNGIDEDCSGGDRVDATVLDNDGDGYTPATGDCDDTEGAVHPDAVELCTDGVDNDCDNMVDTQDPDAVECPLACTDNDYDGYAVKGDGCGPIDCDDRNADINPGAVEICDDRTDNDCDQVTDEGCDLSCPDKDGDGYLDVYCGGADCDDTDGMVNPAAAEVCGNDIDENCNGTSDDVCTTCPDGSVLQINTAVYYYRQRSLEIDGRANSNTLVTLIDSGSGMILAKDLEVRAGIFEEKIRNLAPRQVSAGVTAINAEGCISEELQVRMGNRPAIDDDEDYERSRFRSRYRDRDRARDHDRDHDDD